jgi:hypothetical protein
MQPLIGFRYRRAGRAVSPRDRRRCLCGIVRSERRFTSLQGREAVAAMVHLLYVHWTAHDLKHTVPWSHASLDGSPESSARNERLVSPPGLVTQAGGDGSSGSRPPDVAAAVGVYPPRRSPRQVNKPGPCPVERRYLTVGDLRQTVRSPIVF